MNIVVTKDLGLYPDQKERLEKFGTVTYYQTESASPEEWYERCKDAEIICTGRIGLNSEAVFKLKNVFIALPFVGAEFLDLARLRERNITVANAPGCNKEAVAEWIVGMLLMHFRKLNVLIEPNGLSRSEILETGLSICNKQITILGAGNIGRHLEKILTAFEANVTMFKRGDDLRTATKHSAVIINCLAANESTVNLLDEHFFSSLQKGAFFVSIARPHTYDINALIRALDSGHLAGAIDDVSTALAGDTEDPLYQTLHAHPKILATPHIAWKSESESRKSIDMMIENIAAWIAGTPQNILELH